MYSISVVNIRHDRNAELCGRPSPLGNPYPISSQQSRDTVCDLYDDWFQTRINLQDPLMLTELRRLHRLGKTQGFLKLGCFCKPHRCHVDTIKAFLEENFDFLEELSNV